MQWRFKRGTTTFIVFQATASVFQLGGHLLAWVRYAFQIQFQILNIFSEFNIFNWQTLLVRCDIDNGAIQLFDFNIKFSDADLQFLNMLEAKDFFLGDRFDLSQQFVDFSLEFWFFLFGSK